MGFLGVDVEGVDFARVNGGDAPWGLDILSMPS
jgi:hypothetical protein